VKLRGVNKQFTPTPFIGNISLVWVKLKQKIKNKVNDQARLG